MGEWQANAPNAEDIGNEEGACELACSPGTTRAEHGFGAYLVSFS